ncbi:MAG: acyl-[acyl-carrier-protein] thioesterase [Spirochaetota bacterium]
MQSTLGRRDTYPVRSYHGDLYGRLKPHFVLSFLEDMAWKNAEELGFGYTSLKDQGRFWALTRLSIGFARWPLWGEDLVLETEPLGVSGPFAIRRFGGSVSDTPVFEASSAWVVLDGNTRRPLRPENVFSEEDLARFPGFTPEQVPGKVGEIGEIGAEPAKVLRLSRTVPVTYTELDVNNHVNNAEFLRWAFSLIPPERLSARQVSSIDINFVSELVGNSSMELVGELWDSGAVVAGMSTGKPVFRCKIGL